MKKKTKVLITLLMIFLICSGLILNPAVIIVLLAFYGEYRGKMKAKKIFLKEVKKVKLENPYIYFREIPNKYGIGVSGLLLDFNLDKNDLIAAILDLCAKKYIKINENNDFFEITSLNKVPNDLLSNEVFILNWILTSQNKELKSFDYKEWKYLVKQDALTLGLIEQRKIENDVAPTIADSITKKEKRIMFLIFLSTFLGLSFFSFYSLITEEGILLTELFSNIGHIIITLICSVNSMLVGGFLSGIIYLGMWLITLMFHSFKHSKDYAYNQQIFDTPILTSSGNREVQELYALGNFIKVFGKFADKHIEEIIIWEQYYSYAQLFNLTNYMLETKYKKLTDNECFKVKNIHKVKKIIVN